MVYSQHKIAQNPKVIISFCTPILYLTLSCTLFYGDLKLLNFSTFLKAEFIHNYGILYYSCLGKDILKKTKKADHKKWCIELYLLHFIWFWNLNEKKNISSSRTLCVGRGVDFILKYKFRCDIIEVLTIDTMAIIVCKYIRSTCCKP